MRGTSTERHRSATSEQDPPSLGRSRPSPCCRPAGSRCDVRAARPRQPTSTSLWSWAGTRGPNRARQDAREHRARYVFWSRVHSERRKPSVTMHRAGSAARCPGMQSVPSAASRLVPTLRAPWVLRQRADSPPFNNRKFVNPTSTSGWRPGHAAVRMNSCTTFPYGSKRKRRPAILADASLQFGDDGASRAAPSARKRPRSDGAHANRRAAPASRRVPGRLGRAARVQRPRYPTARTRSRRRTFQL